MTILKESLKTLTNNLKLSISSTNQQLAQYTGYLYKMRAVKSTQDALDDIRRYHVKEFFNGVKRVGGFQNKSQIAIGFRQDSKDGELLDQDTIAEYVRKLYS